MRTNPPRQAAFGATTLCISLLMTSCGNHTASATPADLTDALARAGRSQKVVFLDFGAEWCGPCKQLESTTLVAQDVVTWLREQTIQLRVDIDQSPALAKEFHVSSVPTMLFLRPDRTELGRITGFVDAKKFLRDAASRMRGVTSLAEAREAAAKAPASSFKQFELMQEAQQAGEFEDALAAADAYWHASRKDLTQAGVRVSFFVSAMARLADAHAPARSRAFEWVAAAREQLLAGKNRLQAAAELAALARELREPEAVLDTADALAAKGDDGNRSLRALASAAAKDLVAGRRYELAIAGGSCEPKAVKGRFHMMVGLSKRSAARFADSESSMRRIAAEETLPAFEALAGVGRIDDAVAVAELALQGADAGLREAFADAARRAGHAGLVDRLPR